MSDTTRPGDDATTTCSRDHDIAAMQEILRKGRHVMDGCRPVLLLTTNSATSVPLDPARTLGRDGTPIVWALDETAQMCARHADALAAETERLARDAMAQVDELGTGDVLGACRRAFGMHGSLRRLAGQLGELHAVLDELAHNARPDGAS